jgi:hypothetical protein
MTLRDETGWAQTHPVFVGWVREGKRMIGFKKLTLYGQHLFGSWLFIAPKISSAGVTERATISSGDSAFIRRILLAERRFR